MPALPVLDGAPRAIGELAGKVVAVHFFATWCEPCRPEMKSLGALHARLVGEGLAILAVSVGEADGTVRRFFAADPPPFAISLDRDRAFTRSWGVHTLPTTVILDRDLRPRLMREGDLDWTHEEVVACLGQLLAEPAIMPTDARKP